MKKIGRLFILLILLMAINCKNDVFALSSNDLISVGAGDNTVTVTKTTEIEEISEKLGEPKVVTDSAFGGKAYTFYTDDNYSNYLYIETTKDGDIISYGSVDPTYVTNTYSYGDDYPYYENSGLYGCLFSNSGTVEGGIYYNKSALYNGRYAQIISMFEENYRSNQTKYLRGISEQAVTMYNALSTNLGNKTNLVFNEDFFYINEQFKELGTSIRLYMRDMNKTTIYVKAIGVKENIEISNSIYYVLNPLQFASMATNNRGENFDEKNIAVFDYDYDNRLITALTLRPDAFESVEQVDLTPEEQSKLSSGRYEYEQAEANLNKESEIYDIIPEAETASGLVAGKLKASKAQGITDYVNAIRVAGGLPKLNLNEEAFSIAQHISTLMTYRHEKLDLDIQHQPAQPDGVSDEYYNIAVGGGLGYSENLGYSATETTVNTMKYYINLFLDDSSETPQFFSHRQKLLNAEFTEFGYGISPQMFANEFKGYKATTNYLEAWPSNGITFMESLHNERFQWTAQFTDKYTILNSTTATITCLNTGDVWEFTEAEKTSTRWFDRYTTSIASLNNKVVMYDSTIIPAAGYVYEITLHDVKEDATGKTVDYTYRSVFEYADLDNYPSTLSEINIQVPYTLEKVQDEDVYYLPVGEQVKFSVTIDEHITDKKITWISSDPKVTVTQNGIVYAPIYTDDVTITVSYDGSNITDQIVLRPYNKLEQVQLDKKDITCIALGEDNQDEVSEILYVEYMPDDANEITTVTWKVISETNPDVQYDINDSAITPYLKLTVDENDSRRVYVHAINAETSNNIYTILAKVEGLSGEYTGTCKVTITVPIKSIRILPATIGTSITGRVLNLNCDTYTNDYFDLKTSFSPTNTTESKVISWSVADSNVVTDYNQTGRFKIMKEGSTTITATSSNSEIKDTITVNISATLKSLSLSGVANKKINSSLENNTDLLTLTRVPAMDSDEIKFTSSNSKVATVNDNGLVTFLAPGSVTITAKSVEKPTIYTTFSYTVQMLLDSIQFASSSNGKHINKGETYQNPVKYAPSNTSFANNIKYTSNNPSVAIVDSKGNVTAVGAGSATITATVASSYTSSGTLTASYEIYVDVPLTGVDVVTEKTMTKDSSFRFTVNPIPEDTTELIYVSWESLDEEIVYINENTGMATARNLGETTIIAHITKVSTGETFEKEIDIEVVNYLKGDLDLNGLVDSADAAIALNLFKYNNADEIDLAIGDMDENGLLDSADAAMILNVFKYGL